MLGVVWGKGGKSIFRLVVLFLCGLVLFLPVLKLLLSLLCCLRLILAIIPIEVRRRSPFSPRSEGLFVPDHCVSALSISSNYRIKYMQGFHIKTCMPKIEEYHEGKCRNEKIR